MRQFHKFRSAVRWLVAIVAAALVAAIPTRLSMHNLAVGIPFTWRTRQEVVTSGEQPHTFTLWLLLLDIAIALAVFAMLRIFVRSLIHRRGSADPRQPNGAAKHV